MNYTGALHLLDAVLPALRAAASQGQAAHISLVGSVVGALIIQSLTYAIYSLGVPPEINLVVKAIVVFVVMLLQSPEFRASVGAMARRRPAATGVSA